jgi:hypothetical protein
MPLSTDLNVAPYWDDFSSNTNYHKILFRPQVAVQARELNQVQSILQDQVEKFGEWAFRSGDIVSGCAISDVPVLPFIRLSDFTTNNGSYSVSSLVNAVAYSPTNGLTARVLYAKEGLSTNYPDTMTLYLQYLNTGNTTGPVANATVFSNTDTLTFQNITRDPTTNTTLIVNTFTIAAYANSANQVTVGQAHGITVTEGVVFINGSFVRVPDQTFGLVNNYGTYAGNNVVGFELVETIITDNQDESLLDNALGYPNENAPGAHRLKLTPTLVSYPANAISNTFNIIASYNYGSLVTKSVVGKDLYSIIGSTIERRTYEESGNYILNPWAVDTVTNIGNSVIATLDSNNIIGRISPGVAYAQGTRVELYNTNYVEMRRGIDLAESVQNQITFNYGGYFALNEVAGSFDFTNAANIYFYDTVQQAVTNRLYSGIITPTGNNIGSARMRCFSYNSGTPGSPSSQYLLHVFDIKMANGFSTDQVKSVYANNGSKDGVGDLVSTGLKNSQSKGQLYSFGASGIKQLRNLASNNNTEYTYRTVANKSMSITGNVVVTLTGGNDRLPYGIGTITDSNASEFDLIITSQGTTPALAGLISVSSTNTYVAGVTTTFLSDFEIGSLITVGSDFRRVVSVVNNFELYVDSVFPSTLLAQAYTKTFLEGQILPISTNLTSGKQGSIFVSNTTSFTINTNQQLSSSINVDVVHNVLRTKPSATPKIINKDRFIKIDTSTNPKGPWCLGVPDISRLVKVYASTSTYTTAGADVTRNFVFDSGQKDTHYDLGYLYAKPGYTTTSNPLLLVQVDYYTANTIGANSYGFFSVESYPVDDSLTANIQITVQTKDIPLYVTEAGQKVPLRDVVDFRPFPTNTAFNTGLVDTSNSTQVTAAIALATVNPNNTLVFSNSTLYAPSYSKNFQADYVQYLPRKDLVLVTPNVKIGNNNIKVKEGLSSASPRTPLYPDNAMPLAIIDMPPFPSLSTDQRDELLAVNQSSRSLVRDLSPATSITLVANRRYTMRDIGKLDQRITNLEYYTQLSLLEKKAVDMTVTDENGLDRFKNGIFVEPFSDYAYSEISNPEYNIAIDASKGVGRPKIIREVIPFNFNPASTTTKTGRVVTLPFTEQSFLVQPYATKYRSAAPVAFAWNGTMFLIPSYDNHNDTTNTGSINITIDNTKSWSDFAAGPFGTIWGDWRTTTSSTSQGAQRAPRTFNVNLGNVDGELQDLGPTNTSRNNIWVALRQQGFTPENFVLGTTSFTVGFNRDNEVPGWTLA